MAAPESAAVFISFASEDVELAHRALERLERAGIRCWIADRDIAAATSYPAAITEAVVQCGALLLLLTESANGSLHVLREIELAFNARKPILPVRISGATPSSDLQYFLSTTQWFDAGSTFDETDFGRLEPRLKELLQPGLAKRPQRTGIPRRWPLIAATGLIVAVVAALLALRGGPERDAASTDIGASTSDAATPPPSDSQPGATPATVNAKVNPRDGQAYVWIPAGSFVMGCSSGDPACEDDEKPAHVVRIQDGFWLARTEVTIGQYRKQADGADATRENTDEELPISGIGWAAAKAYCAAVGARLPTEAEWEYAARAGTSTRYYDALPAIAWFADNADDRVHQVAQKAPNAFGLHDMLGNVAEWVRDRYYNRYDDSGAPVIVEEPLAGNASGVARGGSWVSDAGGVRVSRRLDLPPDAELPYVGVRCAIDRP